MGFWPDVPTSVSAGGSLCLMNSNLEYFVLVGCKGESRNFASSVTNIFDDLIHKSNLRVFYSHLTRD